jgi:peptidyl-prolyl cis-trans isomerase D
MLSALRKLTGTWPARVFFLALAAAFVGWGVSGKINFNGGGGATSIATVAGDPIEATVFESSFREAMQRVSQRYPDASQIPPNVRQSVAQQTVEKLVTQKALDDEARRMGVVAPDSAVQAQITAMPAFQGVDGKFDHDTYVTLLARNNLTPVAFQTDVRMDIVKNQLLRAVQAGAHPSEMLVTPNHRRRQRPRCSASTPTTSSATPRRNTVTSG